MNEEPVITTEASQEDPKALRKKDRRHLTWLMGHYFVICALFMGLQYLIPPLALWIFGAEFTEAHYLIMELLPVYVIIVPVAWLLLRHIPAEELPDRYLPPSSVMCAFLVAFAALYLGSYLGTGLNYVVSYFTGWETINALEETMEETGVWEDFLVTVVLAPLVEEFLFRKCLIDRLARYGGKFAIVVSALMFGLYHGNVTQMLYAIPAGLVLGWVYCTTGRMTYSVILHTLINFFGGVLPLLVMEDYSALVVYSFLVLLMLGCGAVLFFVRRKYALSLIPTCGHRAGSALLNAGSILYLLLCLGLIAVSLYCGIL